MPVVPLAFDGKEQRALRIQNFSAVNEQVLNNGIVIISEQFTFNYSGYFFDAVNCFYVFMF